MTETLDAITSRYACRRFTGEPVPHETLKAIAEAGLHAPSAMNRQPWRIIVVEDKAEVDEIGAVGLEGLRKVDEAGYERIQSRGGTLLYNAPAMIIVALQPQPGAFPADLDGGILVSHLALAATSLGVNSCVVAMSKFAFDDPAIKAKYIPEGFDFCLSVLLGYADGTQGAPHEIDESKIIWA